MLGFAKYKKHQTDEYDVFFVMTAMIFFAMFAFCTGVVMECIQYFERERRQSLRSSYTKKIRVSGRPN